MESCDIFYIKVHFMSGSEQMDLQKGAIVQFHLTKGL
jgi:hypothetical protein